MKQLKTHIALLSSKVGKILSIVIVLLGTTLVLSSWADSWSGMKCTSVGAAQTDARGFFDSCKIYTSQGACPTGNACAVFQADPGKYCWWCAGGSCSCTYSSVITVRGYEAIPPDGTGCQWGPGNGGECFCSYGAEQRDMTLYKCN